MVKLSKGTKIWIRYNQVPRFIEEFHYNALGAFFDALIQRTDGCLDVP